MLVSIVAATYNNKAEVLDFIKSVKNLNFPAKELEVIITDNGSTDKTAQLINKQYPEIQLVNLKTNFGASQALNIGFKRAKGQYIFKCDSDVILEKDSLKKLLLFLQNQPKSAIVGPKIFFKDKPNTIAPSAGKFNFWFGTISAYPNLNKILKADYLQGCAILFPKEIIKKIGYLDEGYGLWLFDDQDFCTQANRKGINILYYPEAKIWHSTTLKASARPKIKLEQWYKNKIRFIIKNANLIQILTSIILQIITIPIYWISFRDGTANAIVKGFWWNLNNIKKTLLARKLNVYAVPNG